MIKDTYTFRATDWQVEIKIIKKKKAKRTKEKGKKP